MNIISFLRSNKLTLNQRGLVNHNEVMCLPLLLSPLCQLEGTTLATVWEQHRWNWATDSTTIPALVCLYKGFLIRKKFLSCLCLYHSGPLSSKWPHMLTNIGSGSCQIAIKKRTQKPKNLFLWFVQMTDGSWRISVNYYKFKPVMILNAGAITHVPFNWVSSHSPDTWYSVVVPTNSLFLAQ